MVTIDTDADADADTGEEILAKRTSAKKTLVVTTKKNKDIVLRDR